MTDNKTVLVPIGLAHRNYRTFIALELLINVINLDQEKPRPHFRALGYSGGDMKPRRKAVPQFGSLFCFLFRRNYPLGLDLGLIPRLLILAMRVWWSTKSNAFCISRRASRTDAPVPSVAFSHRCNIDISACVVDEPRMKPYRAGSIDCKTTGTRDMSITKPSATLDRDDVKDISLSINVYFYFPLVSSTIFTYLSHIHNIETN